MPTPPACAASSSEAPRWTRTRRIAFASSGSTKPISMAFAVRLLHRPQAHASRGSCTSLSASFTACTASRPQPSAPHSSAHSCVVGAPPTRNLHLVAVSGLHELLDRHLLVVHGGGQQCREAHQIRLLRLRGLDEPVRVHVGAEVDDVEAGVLKHDRHDGLADVVHVPEHRPHHERADRLLGHGREQRADEREARLHRAGGDEHLRDEDDLLAEAVALEVESREQSVVEDDPRIDVRLDRLRDPFVGVSVVPFLDRLPQGLPFPAFGRTRLPALGNLKHRLRHESPSLFEIADSEPPARPKTVLQFSGYFPYTPKSRCASSIA